MRKITKQFIFAYVFIAFTFTILSCDNNQGNQTSSNVSSNIKIGETINVGNFTYQVDTFIFKKVLRTEFSSKKADGIFLIVRLSLINNDKEEHTIDNSMFKLTDENGTEFESSDEGTTELRNGRI